jgi:subtilisin family serine protease
VRRAAAPLALILVATLPAPAASALPTGRLLVSLKDRGSRAQAAAPAVLARAAVRRDGPAVPEIGLVTVRPPAGVPLARAAAVLEADARVRAVQPEWRARPRFVPNDPALADPEQAPGTPPGTVVQWWAQRMGLPEAWDVARGTRATVAVVDSGIDGNHPELAGKIRGAIDADGTLGAAGPLVDEAGHGTHVASLACAAANDGVGLAGAGHDCGLIVAKTDFSDSGVAQAIVAAADRGAQAVNLSFGTDGARPAPQAYVDALRYASARGAVPVAAAAERTRSDDPVPEEQGDPANVLQPTGTGPNLDSNLGLTVTAADFNDRRAPFAGRGTQISLAAYGTFDRRGAPGLLGAWPSYPTTFDSGDADNRIAPCRCRTRYRGDTRYAYLQGTSMSTALVSATAALVRELNPDLSAPDVVRLLKQTARRPAGTSWEPELGWGIVDARAAVAAARLLDRRPPTSRVSGPRRTRRTRVTLRIRGSDGAAPGVVAAGLDRYEIWRSTSGRRARRIATTRRRTYRVRARRGARYGFFTVAVDKGGNRELLPSRPDVTVRVLRR